jgi:hypothetical protein
MNNILIVSLMVIACIGINLFVSASETTNKVEQTEEGQQNEEPSEEDNEEEEEEESSN